MKINLDEIGKFFERLYLQTLSQKEIKTLNSPISITEIELNFQLKNVSTKKTLGKMASLVNFTIHLKKK